MDTKRSVANNSVASNQEIRMPFIVESFSWALTRAFESWTMQRKRYADQGVYARFCAGEALQPAMGQRTRPVTTRR